MQHFHPYNENTPWFLSRGFFSFFFSLVLTLIICWFLFIGYVGYNVVKDGPEAIGHTIGRTINAIERGYKEGKV